MAFQFAIVAFAVLSATAHAGLVGPITYSTPVVAKVANPAVDAVATTHQNVVRSFGGTVSQYYKAVDTPYSSVRKEDTRISNNVYTPAIAKTVTYAAAPVPTASTTLYATHQTAHVPATAAAVYEHHEPAHLYATHENVHHQPAHVYATYENVHHPAAHVYENVHHQPAHVYATHENIHHQPAHIYDAHADVHHETSTYNHHEAAPTAAATAVYTPTTVTKTVAYAAPEPAHVYQQHHHHQQAPAIPTTTYNHGPDASTYSHNAPGLAAYGTSQTVRYSPAEMVSHMSFDGFGTHWGF